MNKQQLANKIWASAAKTRNYWKYLKTKLTKEGHEVVSTTNQTKLITPAGKRCLIGTLDAHGISALAKRY